MWVLQERSKGPETSPQHLWNPQNVFQEVADIIWRAMAGDGKDAVRWGQCTVVFKEGNSEPFNWRAAKEVVNTALRKGSRVVLSW